MLDLYGATRDELIALVVTQRTVLADRDRQVAALETEVVALRTALAQLTARVGELVAAGADPRSPDDGPTPRGMPGLKSTQPVDRPPRERTRRRHGAARRRAAATARVVHALRRCPGCDAPLAGGTPKRTREVIEVVPAQAVVTEHVYLERRCPDCRRRCVPGPELAGTVVGQGRLGTGLVALIATLREEARLPFATIQGLLRTLYGLELSVGALVGAVGQVAARAGPEVAAIQTGIRGSPVVHADETGWRENGRNGYVWTVSTPQARWFGRGSRAAAMLTAALGDDFGGVLVSDFYGVYTSYAGRHQYCWAHLLRDVDDLVAQHPGDGGVRGWADAVHGIYARARTVADAEATPDPVARQAAARACRAELRTRCAPYLPTAALPTAATGTAPPQRVLCQRITKHLAGLFVFVADPAVPATNNAAERSLRHLVVSRKISGGTRSRAGTTAKMTLASLFGTWRVQGRNPFAECRALLASPQA